MRIGHGIVVFPGGAGTAEEILYLVGILLDPQNEPQPFPVVFTGPRGSEEYWQQIDAFLVGTLGERVRQCYRIIVGDPAEVAREMLRGMGAVREYRRRAERRLQLQLAAAHPARTAAAVRADARGHGGAEPAPRCAAARAGGGPAPRVLRASSPATSRKPGCG